MQMVPRVAHAVDLGTDHLLERRQAQHGLASVVERRHLVAREHPRKSPVFESTGITRSCVLTRPRRHFSWCSSRKSTCSSTNGVGSVTGARHDKLEGLLRRRWRAARDLRLGGRQLSGGGGRELLRALGHVDEAARAGAGQRRQIVRHCAGTLGCRRRRCGVAGGLVLPAERHRPLELQALRAAGARPDAVLRRAPHLLLAAAAALHLAARAGGIQQGRLADGAVAVAGTHRIDLTCDRCARQSVAQQLGSCEHF
mmetsp:Transcript_41321/g.113684  ORF Transcript_41321/g.113684 Transcript_41321/m.113684 type:complete len:255 (-) Transcript_41321:247-1011(-)